MYCGSNKTALASQRQIAEAMMLLIQQKPYDRITVSELCKAAGISRQTFYTLFTSRENVVTFTLQARSCCVPEPLHRGAAPEERESPSRRGLRQICRAYSEYLLHNRGLIRLLVQNHIDYLLYDSFAQSLEHCGEFLGTAEPCTRRYAISFYAGGIASVARCYAREGCTTTAEQLEEMLMTLFDGRLFG